MESQKRLYSKTGKKIYALCKFTSLLVTNNLNKSAAVASFQKKNCIFQPLFGFPAPNEAKLYVMTKVIITMVLKTLVVHTVRENEYSTFGHFR